MMPKFAKRDRILLRVGAKRWESGFIKSIRGIIDGEQFYWVVTKSIRGMRPESQIKPDIALIRDLEKMVSKQAGKAVEVQKIHPSFLIPKKKKKRR